MGQSLRLPWTWLLLLIFIGCGKGFDPELNVLEEIEASQYHAWLSPINLRHGSYRGWAQLNISDNQFWARVKVHGLKTSDMHGQYIHVGGRCPSLKDDANKDGFLDFMELIAVLGPILIPLDGNLTTQQKGIFEFPRMRRHPFYFYSEATNFQWLMEDLRREDVIRDDYITKLPRGSDLGLTRRAVVIYGVDEERFLPSSVRSTPGYSSHRTLPIACGEIRKGFLSGEDLSALIETVYRRSHR